MELIKKINKMKLKYNFNVNLIPHLFLYPKHSLSMKIYIKLIEMLLLLVHNLKLLQLEKEKKLEMMLVLNQNIQSNLLFHYNNNLVSNRLIIIINYQLLLGLRHLLKIIKLDSYSKTLLKLMLGYMILDLMYYLNH